MAEPYGCEESVALKAENEGLSVQLYEATEDLAGCQSACAVIDKRVLEAYRAGEAAMRERAAGRCMELDTRGCSDPECCCAEGPSDTEFAAAIRALPLSDEVPKPCR